MLPILIVKTGETFAEIASAFGDFEDWVMTGFDSSGTNFKIIDARNTHFFPDPLKFSAIVITGSHAMVTERPGWHRHLTEFVCTSREASIPILGICFGHQLLAETFGGHVDFNISGREIGTQKVRLTSQGRRDLLLKGLPREFDVQESHAQEVQEMPPDAVLLATNNHTRVQAFYIEPSIWGVQFHPEFSAAIMQAYVTALWPHLRRESLYPEQIAGKISVTSHSHYILRNFLDIIRDHMGNFC